MKGQFQEILLRTVRCSSHAPEGKAKDVRIYRVQGPLLRVKLHREGGWWVSSCPDLCTHVTSGGYTRMEALREIGVSICATLSCFGAQDDILCHGPKVFKRGMPKSEMRHCYTWGKWREHFGPYIKDVIEDE